MKRFLFIITVVLLTGCSAKYSTNNVQKSTELLVNNLPVAVAKPADGVYETRSYAGSGDTTAAVVKAAILRHSDNVSVYSDCEDLMCLKDKHMMNRGYYVVPQILHWEDRATQWSGIPDRIEIKISVYNAESNAIVASTIITGKSKWATFGGDHPQDLLPVPINAWIASLY
ncbi:hypothetical protein LH23_14780 [Cedecea neteri]|uniref:DUF4823 domain-containing protein n=1 Tax=Cedecea neteri TaxID=158822 RepID=A0AAN0VUR5_9ENTR|nr:DUF4823 domain-containing protein [Cedecea neteri]AIR61870.1 hypothetical protein LH23_14780 [Cedecea neteri]